MSFIVSDANQAGEGPSLAGLRAKKEEVEDFTFDEPNQKKQKTSGACLGRSTLPSSEKKTQWNELNMSWDLIEVLIWLFVCFMCGKSVTC